MSQNTPFTREQQQEVAQALRAACPAPAPGMNSIPQDAALYDVWHRTVTQVAEVTCRGRGDAQDRIDAAFFFERCGARSIKG